MAMENQQAKDVSSTPFQDDAQEYLKKHKLPELFEILTSLLVYTRPDDPKEFIKNYLKQLQESRNTKNDRKLPRFFDDSNIISIFGMLDVSRCGHISLEQYQQAMETLGVTEYNKNPIGADINKINEDTFIQEASSGLQKHYQAYYSD